MSECLGAVVRAPMTGILIGFEMTHEFAVVSALMLGALVSQAISRQLLRHSFCDAILVQDGHRIEPLIPPRELAGWRRQPVSALATRTPVMVENLEPPALARLLRDRPYGRFPVWIHGRLEGVLTRAEAQVALVEKRAPRPALAVVCRPEASVRELWRSYWSRPPGLWGSGTRATAVSGERGPDRASFRLGLGLRREAVGSTCRGGLGKLAWSRVAREDGDGRIRRLKTHHVQRSTDRSGRAGEGA